ncbi:MAG: dynein gamma chain protein, partial [Clostridia bacterium]|nr:dynein gamma chain protein [Clostridia bacterium]
MCTNGVNTNQLKDTISMIDESAALNRRWTHKMFHLAQNGGLEKSAATLKEIQEAFDDIRDK